MTWDAIVIGAGPSGAFAAERLRAAGQRVLLIEAGGRSGKREERTADTDPRWRFRSLGARATWWRAHGVGGNSLLWGGWASRFPAAVLRDAGFPAELAAEYPGAERWLGVEQGVLDPRYRRAARALGVTIVPRRNARRGVHTWTAKHSAAARSARTHTVALRLVREAGSDVTAVETLGPCGLELLRARAFVLALSPLESYRLLALSGFDHPELGHSLGDHLVAHSLLIEPHAAAPSGERGPFPGSAFAPPAADGIGVELIGPFPIGARERQRLAADGVRPARGARVTRINAMAALDPHPQRFVDLAPRARDTLGRPELRIHFAWSDAERRLPARLGAACARFADSLATRGAQLIEFQTSLESPSVFHPSGTCRMGEDPAAPCDLHGKLRAASNVWLADASVFPAPGDRHPTLTVLAHAARVARSVVRENGKVLS